MVPKVEQPKSGMENSSGIPFSRRLVTNYIAHVFGPGYSTVHHRIKWPVMRRLICHTQNQETLEPYIKSSLAIELGRDLLKPRPNY